MFIIKQVVFEGNSLKTIKEFPAIARQRIGFEIDRTQRGMEPLNWKPMPTISTGVREIRIQVGLQYRIIYIAKFDDKVHVLHAFQKKTQKTPRADIALAKKRMMDVARKYTK